MNNEEKEIVQKVVTIINNSANFYKTAIFGGYHSSDIIRYQFDNYLSIEWYGGGYKIFHKGNKIYHLVDLELGRELSDAIDKAQARFKAQNINEFLKA